MTTYEWVPESLEASGWEGHLLLKTLKYKERNALMRNHPIDVEESKKDFGKLADTLDTMYDLAEAVVVGAKLSKGEEVIDNADDALNHPELGFIVSEVQGKIFSIGVAAKK